MTASEGNNLWDGMYRGQKVDRGAYLYYANVLYLDGVEEIVAGIVMVVH